MAKKRFLPLRRAFFSILCMALLLGCFPLRLATVAAEAFNIQSKDPDGYAHSRDDIPGPGWYASPELQDAIWKDLEEGKDTGLSLRTLQEDSDIFPVKESITLQYGFDLFRYAQTGEFVIDYGKFFNANAVFSDGAFITFIFTFTGSIFLSSNCSGKITLRGSSYSPVLKISEQSR